MSYIAANIVIIGTGISGVLNYLNAYDIKSDVLEADNHIVVIAPNDVIAQDHIAMNISQSLNTIAWQLVIGIMPF